MSQKKEIKVPINAHFLEGILTLPDHATSLVVFAHGSGSSRFSKRNQQVAEKLNSAKIATLLFDLLTPEEEMIDEYTHELRFNIPLLTDRILLVSHWLEQQESTKDLALGYFGASTGAAAALMAAAKLPFKIKAVVSRGGRPDLAGNALILVQAASLFIVGENDPQVLALNQLAMEKLSCEKQLIIIKHATHLFEEPGTLEKAADFARDWFTTHL
jgi:dienelactone hydrolase